MSASEAIDPRSSVVVAASAGTGKTYLLVSRLTRLLLEGVDPARVLAITFTRKAAGEMQERLHARLRQLAECGPAELDAQLRALGVAADQGTRAAARTLYANMLLHETGARIQTFHAFCVDLLRRFPLDAEVPAGFTIAESTELLLQEAWDEIFARATRTPSGTLAQSLQCLFETYGTLEAARRSLESFVAHRGDWWPYTHGVTDPVQHARDLATELISEQETPAAPDAEVQASLSRYAELLIAHGTATDLQHAEKINATAEADDDDAFATLLEVFFTRSDPFAPRVRKSTQTAVSRLGESQAKELLDLHEQLQHTLGQQRVARDVRQYRALVQAWLHAGQILLRAYQAVKRRRRVLDFADLEWQSLRLLHDCPDTEWVQFKLDQRIDHVLIDEFQDTNPTQWYLLLPLLEEILAHRDHQRSVFIVGDKKQSIYGFRRADPTLQDAAAAWLTQHADARVVHLDRSYRAAPPLMTAVNQVFADPGSLLEDFQAHSTHLDTWGALELLAPFKREDEPTPKSDGLRDPLTQPPPARRGSGHFLEGAALADHMRALMDRRTTIDDGGRTRPLTFGDCMVLLRSRTHVADYERAFIDAQIPFVSTDFGTLLDALEIRDLVALIETLSMPFNDVALVQVLRSPMFAVDHEMLERLAEEQSDTHWFGRLPAVARHLDDEHPLARAARLLPRWRALLGKLPTHDWLHRIFHEGEFIARYRLAFPEPLDARSSRNLSRLLELALELDSGRYPSPHSFLAHLHALRETQHDAPSEPPQQLSDRVRLMTVHAAKGLEAPVVYLADAAAATKPPDAHRALVDWPSQADRPRSFLPGVSRRKTPPSIEDLRQHLQARQQREESNLLYVAMTRARQLLVISATQTREDVSDSWYARVRQRVASLAVEQPDGRLTFGDPPPVLDVGATVTTCEVIPERVLPRPRPTARPAIPAYPSEREPALRYETSSDSDGLARGNAVHRLLEALAQVAPSEREATLDRLRDEFALPPETFTEFVEEARRVMEHADFRRFFDAACFEQAWNEVPISYYDASGELISGVIDRLIKYPRSVTVIDYKTHQITAAQAQAMAPTFVEQLQGYAQGISRVWPDVPVHTLVLFTALPLAVDVTPASGQQLRLFTDV